MAHAVSERLTSCSVTVRDSVLATFLGAGSCLPGVTLLDPLIQALAARRGSHVAEPEASTKIDKTKIGLIGHSEGGMIAPLVAVQSNDVAFMVMMAGLGIPGDSNFYICKVN